MKLFTALMFAANCGLSGLVFAAGGPVAVEPAAIPFKIGTLQAFALRDAQFVAPNDGSVFGVDAAPGEVAKVLQAAGAPPDTITVSVNALLLRDGDRVLLFDTGLGPEAHGVLLQSLAKAGISPAEVTDVLITHVHGDHIGGVAAADGGPAFPKAVVRMSSAEWDYMKSQSNLAALVKLIGSQVQTFAPGAVLAPGVAAVAFKGHTPGHMGYEITSGTERLLDIGDTAHSSIVSLQRPDWAMGFDIDRAVGKATRMALPADLSKSHESVFSPHFPYPGIGTVKAQSGATVVHYVWLPAAR